MGGTKNPTPVKKWGVLGVGWLHGSFRLGLGAGHLREAVKGQDGPTAGDQVGLSLLELL